MIGREDLGSWLEGPGAGRNAADGAPGQRLGLPAAGPGSIAGFGRRLIALALDWAVCSLIARAFVSSVAWGPLGVFALEQLLLVGTVGFGLGHRLLGLRIVRLDGGLAGPARAAVRTALLALAFPALIWDRDGRGLHDKAAGTVVVRL
jgi:uncharacterized RDD family membrane protein YckC